MYDVRRLLTRNCCWRGEGPGRALRALEERPGSKRYLEKLLIPAAAKTDIRNELAYLGVRRRTLFPDLENLAHDLAFEYGATD